MALNEARKARIARSLRELGYEPNEDNIEQMSVFCDALEIYIEREQTRGGVWKEFSIEDAATQIKSKAARLIRSAQGFGAANSEHARVAHDNELRDSALDSVNYAAFAERHRRAGRYTEPEGDL